MKKEEIKLKPSLERFLKEKGAYNEFIDNIIKEWESLPMNFLGFKGSRCITTAFDWESTPSGVDFWGNIASEFNKYDNETTE